MAEPSAPDAGTREHVLAVLADCIERAGAERFLRPPVAPGAAAFPDPWAPTPAGVQVLVRRLAWHADLAACGVREVKIDDRRAGKPVTERMPATRIEAAELRAGVATFVLGYIGADNVAGTAAHEVGALFAALHRPAAADPYRSAEPPAIEVDAGDAERGSIATVYLGLGVLAANAAFQEYSRAGKFNGAYEALEHDVLRAGAVPMSVLAYAVAVQAVVRAEVGGGAAEAPKGLRGPQTDEVRAWIAALRTRGPELVEQLGLARAGTASAGNATTAGAASASDAATAGAASASDAATRAPAAARVNEAATRGPAAARVNEAATRAPAAARVNEAATRGPAIAFADVDAQAVARDERAEERRFAFRWRTHRGGIGVIAGAVVGVGFALIAGRGVAPWLVFGGASSGHVIGRRVRVPRCSACSTVVLDDASVCPRCGAALRGDIDRLSDRLDAEERIEAEAHALRADGTDGDADSGSAAS